MKNVETMNCSEALRLARDSGMRVSRLAWNDEKFQTTSWVGALPSEIFGLTCETFAVAGLADGTGANGEEMCPLFYYAWSGVQNESPHGCATLGYSPSQADILATDWFVVDNNGIKPRGQGK